MLFGAPRRPDNKNKGIFAKLWNFGGRVFNYFTDNRSNDDDSEEDIDLEDQDLSAILVNESGT